MMRPSRSRTMMLSWTRARMSELSAQIGPSISVPRPVSVSRSCGERTLQAIQQRVGLERFPEQAHRAGGVSLALERGVRARGDHDHGRRIAHGAQPLGHLDAAEARHLDVGDDAAALAVLDAKERLGASEAARLVADRAQHADQRLAQGIVILDDRDELVRLFDCHFLSMRPYL